MINILFVCAGNTCRSAMCEYLFKHMLSQHNLSDKFNVKSCGVYANQDQPAAENAIKIIEILNIEIKNHKSQPISLDLIKNSNYIFALDNVILQYIKYYFDDEIKGAVSCISNQGIPDPYGSSLNQYQLCCVDIKKSLENILDKIIKDEKL